MEPAALIGLIVGAAVAVFLGTLTILAGILGASAEPPKSLLGPVMVEDVLEDELRDVYLSARLLEADGEDWRRLAREIRRYVIELQAARCETGSTLELDERVVNLLGMSSAPDQAVESVRKLRRDLVNESGHSSSMPETNAGLY